MGFRSLQCSALRLVRPHLVALFVGTLALDQFTKALAVSRLTPGVPHEVLPGFLQFTLSRNRGMVFGFLSGVEFPGKEWVLTGVALASLFLICWLVARETDAGPLATIPLAGIVAGGVGNVLDRVRFGSVVDFVDVHVGDWHWPTFNVADSAITVGILLMLFGFFREAKPVREA